MGWINSVGITRRYDQRIGLHFNSAIKCLNYTSPSHSVIVALHMAKTETIEEFYKNKFRGLPAGLQQELGQFNVFNLEDCNGAGKTPVQYSRRDFYKFHW